MIVIMSFLLCFVDSASPSVVSVGEDDCCSSSSGRADCEDECDLCRRDDDDDDDDDDKVCSEIVSPFLFSLDTPML